MQAPVQEALYKRVSRVNPQSGNSRQRRASYYVVRNNDMLVCT